MIKTTPDVLDVKQSTTYHEQLDIHIDELIANNILIIVSAFKQVGWDKPQSLFKKYLKAQETGRRCTWTAHVQGEFAGYVSLKWQSDYLDFKEKNSRDCRFKCVTQLSKKWRRIIAT